LGTGMLGLFFFVRFLLEAFRVGWPARASRSLVHPFFALLATSYFAIFCLSEHLFGLNVTPALVLVVCLYHTALWERRAPASVGSEQDEPALRPAWA